jgi:hypothetical protein
VVLVLAGSQVSCQWLFRSHAKTYPGVQAGQVGQFSSDKVELADIRDFYQRVFGNVDGGYITEWAKLDEFRSGRVIDERIPYLDSWYPERNGGTNVNGTLTRYDQAFYQSKSTAADWEFENNNRQTPSWYGHCNGTSVAASRFQNPTTSVTRPDGCELDPDVNCVIFSPADIRALLAEINMNAKAKFISGNRCALSRDELDARPLLRADPLTMDACDDVNPGSFHVGMVNFLGRKKQPVIFDLNQDREVWNYPVYDYSYTVEGPLDEAAAIERLGFDLAEWIFNPDAEQWYHVTMDITYRRAVSGFSGAGTTPAGTQKTYTYLLEIDQDGHVVGGEWTGESQRDHPDFIWMAFEPAAPTGASSRGNPHVSNEEVISMWAESVGFDPENPFRDKPDNPYDVRFYPEFDHDQWGDIEGYYRLVLDGRTTGTVFRGKKTHLRVLMADVLKQDSSVDVYLNGQSLGRRRPEDGKVDVIFDSPPGINYLNLKWDSAKVSSSELDWEFRYYAM